MNTERPLDTVLLLIPCCGSKGGDGSSPHLQSPPLEQEVSASSLTVLRDGQAETAKKWPQAFNRTSRLLPAMVWYTGRPYSVPHFRESLDRALEQGLRCLIISAGYGLLRPDDPIHRYDLQMGRALAIWRHRLPLILADYVARNRVTRVFGALSQKYYEAVAPLEDRVHGVRVWWHVPTFQRGVDNGSAMTAVPEAVGRSVIELIESDFVPGPAWQSSSPPRLDSRYGIRPNEL